MASIVYLYDGSDATQGTTGISNITGSVTSATDQSYTGPRSLKLNMPVPTAASGDILNVLADTGRRFSFRVRFDSVAWPGTNPAFMRFQQSAASNNVCVLGFQTGTAKLYIQPTGATLAAGSTVLSANTWYRITVSLTITNTTTFRFQLYINGVAEANATAGTMTRTGISRINFIIQNNGSALNTWFDDLYIDDGTDYADPGTTNANALRVTAKRPFANGTVNGFTTQIGSGGSGYGSGHAPQVNEQPLSVTNGWSMVGAGAAVTEEYTIEDRASGDVNISGNPIVGYMGWIFAASSGSQTGQIIAGGATSNVALTTTNTYFTKPVTSAAYPSGGDAVGIVTTTALQTVSLFEAGVLVAFNQTGNPWYQYSATRQQAI